MLPSAIDPHWFDRGTSVSIALPMLHKPIDPFRIHPRVMSGRRCRTKRPGLMLGTPEGRSETKVADANRKFLPDAHHKFEVVREFVGALDEVEAMADLRTRIADASKALGFDYFAIVHHIRFGHPTTDKIRLSNYPLEWLALLREDDHFEEPVLKAAERAGSGFRWSRLHEHIQLTERQQKYMERAVRH